ncbi:hypothetical protein C4544_05410 [candidate division WS5 bacterium]|uniref:CMP/dCMP-type deaminase domain-containing protein n=1 Tax=candidate division WS5 bacterium TaxID=2093353 RepID=A0A419DAV7_9BACT|nr:MAG: hypothetical protein C4544_05410 [candidate division WS5 bacterium]
MKIITPKELKIIIRPYTVTLFGDVFDLFNVEHVRFLRECSNIGRPLVVIVQADKTARVRLGFNRPIMNEKSRAEMVAALEFVDFVLILKRPSDYDKYLEIIKPKYYIFPKGIMKHRKYAASLIRKKYPRTKVVFIKSNVHRYNLDNSLSKAKEKRNYSKIKNSIIRRLYFIADNSSASVGKISAIITLGDKIIAESDNVEGRNMHAEEIVINKAKTKGFDLEKIKLYVLIPPCILCAKKILKNSISEVYYLHDYGNDDGLELLHKNGVKVRKMKF